MKWSVSGFNALIHAPQIIDRCSGITWIVYSAADADKNHDETTPTNTTMNKHIFQISYTVSKSI